MKQRKKVWSMMVIMVLALFMGLAGCGKDKASGGQGDKKTYKIIMTHELPETFFKHKYMEKFKEIVEEKSNGQLEVTIHSGGQLFKDGEAIQALGTGSVHMVWPVSAHLEALNQKYGVVSLPFGLNDKTILENVEYRTELTGLLNSFVEDKGIKVLGLMRTAEGIILTKDKELKNLKDLSGLKVRTVSGQVATDTIEAFKGSGVSMPATEIATSLSQGVIDGVNTSPDGWKDVVGSSAKYGLVVPGMQLFTYSIAADKAWFDGLPKDLQTLISDTINDITVTQWKESMELDKEYIEKVTSDWGKVNYVPESDVNDWKKATEDVYKKFEQRHPDALKAFNELTKK
ncbi:TRAP transporter substrate-binding protein DctP [Neobacillus niacini]|uniref:TRAP transporter substrate-binding protein n=1 Tax=Neobacillus niacini TaxID=86668 RepID=UPI0007AB6660|nr:TRAP transporter substrate-binding protein DctP [Neobacillus niacini]MEC1525432.1 TRAP transporter substrate-binding protein DctP [Neobacillus niacini]